MNFNSHMYKFSNYFLYICYKMSRMPKLSMEISESMEMLNETEYLDKPQKPSSVPKEKPPKKKRVMSEAQLANLSKAREKSALNRRLKKEQKVADKVALKEEKKLRKKKMPKVEAQHHNEVVEAPSSDEEEVEEENYQPTNGVDYEFIMSNVYGMIKEDETNRLQKVEDDRLAQEDYDNRKDTYDNKIRQEERDRLMGIVEEKRKKKKNTAPLMNNQPNWDSCFQPRGRGSDQFF